MSASTPVHGFCRTQMLCCFRSGCNLVKKIGFEGGLRKYPIPRTTGNELGLRLNHAHTSIVADGLCHSLL
jgi:hypothetical protein